VREQYQYQGHVACSMYHGTSDRACGGTVVE
jgi:hypothetical protein